jgi:hypothetical protein
MPPICSRGGSGFARSLPEISLGGYAAPMPDAAAVVRPGPPPDVGPLKVIADLTYRVSALEAVLRDREAELLALKGPCSNARCPLHYAHSGPCNVQ